MPYPIKLLITIVLLACKLACHQGDLSGMLIKYRVVITTLFGHVFLLGIRELSVHPVVFSHN